MDDEPPPLVTDDPAQRSLIDDVKQLADDGRTLVEAELAYQKSRAAVAGIAVRRTALWGLAGVSLVFFALMALVIGMLLGLSAVIGPGMATGLVVAGLAIGGLICALLAIASWRRSSAALSDKARQ